MRPGHTFNLHLKHYHYCTDLSCFMSYFKITNPDTQPHNYKTTGNSITPISFTAWLSDSSLFISSYIFPRWHILSSVCSSAGGSLALRHDTRSSSYTDTRSRPSIPVINHNPKAGLRCSGYASHDPSALQSLLVVSTRAPLVRRPGFSHIVRNSSRRAPQHGKGQWGADKRGTWGGREALNCENAETYCACDECLHVCRQILYLDTCSLCCLPLYNLQHCRNIMAY